MKDGIDAKFRLWPQVALAYNDGYDARTLRQLAEIVAHRRREVTHVWNEFFGEAG